MPTISKRVIMSARLCAKPTQTHFYLIDLPILLPIVYTVYACVRTPADPLTIMSQRSAVRFNPRPHGDNLQDANLHLEISL